MQNKESKDGKIHGLTTQASDKSIEEARMWHLRLGHLPFNKLKLLFPEFINSKVNNRILCIICPLAKQTRLALIIALYKPLMFFN